MPETVASENLRLFMERIERLEEEKRGISDDIRDVFNEAKSNGYDTKTMKRIIKLRKMEPHARQEAEALLDTYMNALGMTPIEAESALTMLLTGCTAGGVYRGRAAGCLQRADRQG